MGKVCAFLGSMQQRIMLDEWYDPALDIYRILLAILENGEAGGNAGSGEPCWEAVLDAYIDAHIGEKITNQQLARVCGMSLSYFMKQLKSFHRVTPQEYVMNRRITKAKYLLTQTGMSVEQMAESLGFCNSSHLVKRFREREGMTPAWYRKNYSVVSKFP